MSSQNLALLNRQAITAAKRYMGRPAWGTVALTGAVAIAYIVTLTLATQGSLPLLPAFLLLAIFTYFSYTPLHEAAHGNIHGERASLAWLNDLCGYVSAQMMLLPYVTHRVEHFAHHRYTNQPDRDPDHLINGMSAGLWGFIKSALAFIWSQWTYLFHGYWSTAPRREKLTFILEFTVALGWRFALLTWLPLQTGLILIVAAWFTGGLFTAYWFAYRPHHPYAETTRYRNTSSLIMPTWMRPLEWFWLGQNLHSIHHAFPRVPFYRYHALFREVEPVLRAHGGPVIGVFSRQPVAANREVKS
ncbi:fatty acid desaturase family protein [Perlucidibaca aquatica]|uniref:fatty acid desaturase family protein n=1 Tax=Perlucidibaca aquatica TaxID=1852776 RepID=UPI00083AE94E|nr:fatty acid desaturase [Perlucidibaca aquatica]